MFFLSQNGANQNCNSDSSRYKISVICESCSKQAYMFKKPVKQNTITACVNNDPENSMGTISNKPTQADIKFIQCYDPTPIHY